ncbi:MAG: MobC family plasmid mobilization relaxosome protein [Lachnospiraceae bacterium]|nr:MobC family plasmid mobilization relaxosome protein [Lachnospiraceae bacterium]
MAMELRKAYRLTKEQDEELKRKVEELGMTESEFIRLLITEKPKDYPEIRQMLTGLVDEVNRIGININEIVRNNNSSLYSDSDKSRLIAYMVKLNEKLSKVVDDIGDN